MEGGDNTLCSAKTSKPQVSSECIIKIQVTIILFELHHILSSQRLTHLSLSELCHESSVLGLECDNAEAVSSAPMQE